MNRIKVFLALGIALSVIPDVRAGGCLEIPDTSSILKVYSSSEVYSADAGRLRDPFAPLDPRQMREVAVSTSNIQLENLELKGVLISRSIQLAIILDLVTEARYILKNEILMTLSNIQVSGISGRIEKNRVVLIDSNKKVVALVLGNGQSQDPFIPPLQSAR